MNDSILKVLIVDDDNTQIQLLKTYIKHIEYPEIKYFTAVDAEQALSILDKNTVNLVLSDFRLPGKSGLELLQEVKQINPLIEVVIMTAYENARQAVDILQGGGDDYLIKPTSKNDIEHLFIKVFEKICRKFENIKITDEINVKFENLPIVYKSQEMQGILNTVARTSQSSATVLITGESGTGKELIATLIHQTSLRKDKPFVPLNIAALPESLMESELFGHIKGSFTGAEQNRIGRFEEADGGTLFIDEIGDIPPAIQVKLLRAIQFGQIQRIGENSIRSLDVRIIAATNRNLEQMITENKFRSDLYWRINVIRISIPPLRKRKIDITALSDFFIEKYNKKNDRSIKGITNEGMDRLMRHPFHGNIRELENIIERCVITARGSIITEKDLSLQADNSFEAECVDDAAADEYDRRMQEFEIRLLMRALKDSEGNQSKASRQLGITERRLRSRLKILDIKNS